MNSFKTTKGTELPILNLKGKDYLEVKYRLVWFREEHPDWSIETELVHVGADYAVAKATIKDEKGRIISTSHKHENKAGFSDFHEKAESGSIGRALALLGYGTQFCADELDEGQRVVDSPVQQRPKTQPAAKAPAQAKTSIPSVFSDEDFGEFVCTFGKHKGKKLKDFGEVTLEGYRQWLSKQSNLNSTSRTFLEKSEAYLRSMEFNRDGEPSINPNDDIPY